MAYYVACIFHAVHSFVLQAQRVYSKLVLKRPWIAADTAHHLLSSLKIARGPEVRQGLETAFCGFALRRCSGGQLISLSEGHQPPIADRFVALIRTMRKLMPSDDWGQLRDDIAAYRCGQFAVRTKILARIKLVLMQQGRREAAVKLRTRLHH